MRIRGRGWFGGLVVATSMVVLAGCGTDSPSAPTTAAPPPSAAALISSSAAALRTVTSAHFVISVTGTVPDLKVQSAQGDLASAGDAKGTATVNQGGQLVEIEFVIVGPDLYVKGATGGYTKIPAALAGQVYDPTAILDPDAGVAKVLTSASSLSSVTEADGAYVVTGSVPKDVAASLTPGVSTNVDATFTLDKSSSLPRTVSFALTGADSAPASVQLALSDYNKGLSITAPTGS